MRDCEPISAEAFFANVEARIQRYTEQFNAVDKRELIKEPEPETVYAPQLTSKHINTLAKRRQKQKFKKPPPKHPDAR